MDHCWETGNSSLWPGRLSRILFQAWCTIVCVSFCQLSMRMLTAVLIWNYFQNWMTDIAWGFCSRGWVGAGVFVDIWVAITEDGWRGGNGANACLSSRVAISLCVPMVVSMRAKVLHICNDLIKWLKQSSGVGRDVHNRDARMSVSEQLGVARNIVEQ